MATNAFLILCICPVIWSAGLFDKPGVFLTVRSNVPTPLPLFPVQDRHLEANWYNLPQNMVDSGWIGVFDYDPTKGMEKQPRFYTSVLGAASGTRNTGTKFERLDYRNYNGGVATGGPAGGECVGFWIAAFPRQDSTRPELVNCMKVFPTWMNKLKDSIGNRPMSKLMIPGTHDAGSWNFYQRPPPIPNPLALAYTQEDTIYSQLYHGIRYLDVRVAYGTVTRERFQINHGPLIIRPLSTLLTDVRDFVREKREIVIMDFHQLWGDDFSQSDERQEELRIFVEDAMGDVLVKRSAVKGSNPSANDIWKSGGYVLWTYPNQTVQQQHDTMWPTVQHAWGNKQQVNELHGYLENEAIPTYGCKRSWFWSAMAELTNNGLQLTTPRRQSQLVNLPLTEWYRSPSWYSRTNIVATDYYLGNNIIQMSMRVNKNRASCPA